MLLSEIGKKQAHSLADYLKNMRIEAIYASPLKRAIDTAKVIARQHNLPVTTEPTFKELDVGDLEGMSLETLSSDFTQFLTEWRAGSCSIKLPKGESLDDLQDRVWTTVQSIIQAYRGDVVIVSHFFAILAIVCTAIGMPLNGARRFRIQPASISIIDFAGTKPCLILLGDTCHTTSKS